MELLLVVFQAQRFKDIGHWVMTRIGLVGAVVQSASAHQYANDISFRVRHHLDPTSNSLQASA